MEPNNRDQRGGQINVPTRKTSMDFLDRADTLDLNFINYPFVGWVDHIVNGPTGVLSGLVVNFTREQSLVNGMNPPADSFTIGRTQQILTSTSIWQRQDVDRMGWSLWVEIVSGGGAGGALAAPSDSITSTSSTSYASSKAVNTINNLVVALTTKVNTIEGRVQSLEDELTNP